MFAQSWNGVASFVGPLIASKFFFTGTNANNLINVQYVYLAVSAMGVIIALLFIFSKLPEMSEEALQAELDVASEEDGIMAAGKGEVVPIYRCTRAVLGFVAQFCYTGAQVTIGTFFINYLAESRYTDAEASNLLSFALITFTVCRFIGAAILTKVNAALVLTTCATLCGVFLIILVALPPGAGGLGCLFALYALMSIQYPVIFVLGTSGLGRNTRRGAALIVMGVAGETELQIWGFKM